MSSSLKTVLQYIVILAVTVLLIWFSLRNLTVSGSNSGAEKWTYLTVTWKAADKGWLIFMALLALLSHVIRAERWRMLIKPSGNNTTLGYSFLSLMVGYIVNLVIPRGGEISRCYNLYKLDKTPVEISFGTVVVERVVDLICLLSLIILAFAVESKKLFLFMRTLPLGTGQSRLNMLVLTLVIIVITTTALYFLFKRSPAVNTFVIRMWSGFKEGLLSIFRLERKGLFIAYSLLIWGLYFIMSYTVIQAFPETNHLGLSAVLSLFAIGSIAMAVPLPGGTGSYHVLVPQGLVFLYHIPQANAVAFTFIFHGWQTAIMIVSGAISLIITSFLVRQKSFRK